MEEELRRFGKNYEFHSYPNAGHAFLAVNNQTYRQEAAFDAWRRIFDWFAKYLKD
jgi:carboxymethylenebutenolidase